MSATKVPRFQALPPKGGYPPINFTRTIRPNIFKSWQLIGGYIVTTTVGITLFFLGDRQLYKEEIELRSSTFAIYPLLMAERDREYLKQIRRNRDEEADLMKNVKGWKVGTWYGEPIFHLRKETDWIDPCLEEYYAHCQRKFLIDKHELKDRN